MLCANQASSLFDLLQDMKDECSKHGPLKRVIIPRPTPTVPHPPGLAKVSFFHPKELEENPSLFSVLNQR